MQKQNWVHVQGRMFNERHNNALKMYGGVVCSVEVEVRQAEPVSGLQATRVGNDVMHSAGNVPRRCAY